MSGFDPLVTREVLVIESKNVFYAVHEHSGYQPGVIDLNA